MSFCILLFPFGWDISIIFQANEAFRAQISRVCAVAQCAVLEANARVNGRGSFSHPHPSETPQPISMSCQIYYYVPPGSWCAKFGWNRFGRYGSAHAWKKHVLCGFFIIPAKAFARDYVITGVRLSVCLFVTTIKRGRIWTNFFGKVLTGKSKPKFVCGYDR